MVSQPSLLRIAPPLPCSLPVPRASQFSMVTLLSVTVLPFQRPPPLVPALLPEMLQLVIVIAVAYEALPMAPQPPVLLLRVKVQLAMETEPEPFAAL